MENKDNQNYFRPAWHFTPKQGWLNDPNGLIFHDGLWHMYFQHNPLDTVWGPMHWGHAVSRDLLHWEELPIALYPYGDDGNITCFSGSMVYDKDNTSGLEKPAGAGKTTKGVRPLAAFYTSHSMRDHMEDQSIALSYDGGTSFERYPGNPVISTPVMVKDGRTERIRDFRDPKVFRNPYTGRWNMTLAAMQGCWFYASDDLIHWEKTGEFTHPYAEITNVWACTDLIPFETADGRRWVLLASMENDEGRPEARTMYFVGDFDGKCFTPLEITKEPLWLDFGWDNYAGVSFNDTGEKKYMICWAVNPRYANQVPTAAEGYRGVMSLAREMSLVRTVQGYRLALRPVLPEDRQGAVSVDTEECPGDSRESAGPDSIPIAPACVLRVSGGCGRVRLCNETGEYFEITVDQDRVTVDRTHAGIRGFHPDFSTEAFSRRSTERLRREDPDAGSGAKRQSAPDDSIDMCVVYDRSIIEVYADGGLETATVNVFPTAAYTRAEADGILRIR